MTNKERLDAIKKRFSFDSNIYVIGSEEGYIRIYSKYNMLNHIHLKLANEIEHTELVGVVSDDMYILLEDKLFDYKEAK